MTGGPARLPALLPGDLDVQQQALREQIAGGPRASGPQLFALTDAAGGLTGPFNAMLLSPSLGQALQALGAALRYRCSLAPRVREMAVLQVAAHEDCAFERYAHEPIARSVGVTAREVEVLRRGGLPAVEGRERAALRVVEALLRRADLADAEYADAGAEVGVREVFELTTLVGYYTTLALQLRVFRVATPPA